MFASIFAAITMAATAFSSVQQHKAAKKAAKQARESQNLEMQRKQREMARLRGSQRAAYAKGGVKLSGTPTAVIDDSADQGLLDMSVIQKNGDRQVARYNSQANQSLVTGVSSLASLGSQFSKEF